MKSLIYKILFFVGGSLAIMYGSYYFFSINDPKFIKIDPPSSCDFQNNDCTIPLPQGGTVFFSIAPRPVPFADPFKVIVKFDNTNLAIQSVMVDFTALLEDAGYRRPQLKKISNQEFSIQTDLSHCKDEEMLWQVTVLIRLEKDTLAIPFKLHTYRTKKTEENK